MNRIALLLIGISFAWICETQSPQLAIIAGFGSWQGKLRNNGYIEYRPIPQVCGSLGIGVSQKLSSKLDFASELGLELYQMNYNFSSPRDDRQLLSRLSLWSARVSPGLNLRPWKGLALRAAVTFMFSSGASGSLQVYTYRSGQGVFLTGNYQQDFGHIRNWGNVGPELNVGYLFSLKRGGLIGPRISSYIGKVPLFKASVDTPVNPAIYRLSLELSYVFACRQRE